MCENQAMPCAFSLRFCRRWGTCAPGLFKIEAAAIDRLFALLAL
jgi:hypothetical protein